MRLNNVIRVVMYASFLATPLETYGGEPRVTLKRLTRELAAPPEGWIAETAVISPDGQRVAYAVKADGKYRIYVDEKASRSYLDLSKMAGIVFSSDSKHVAYAAKDEQGCHMIIDGAVGDAFEEVGPAVFSPDSGHSVYVGSRKKQFILVCDGRPREPLDNLYQIGDGSDMYAFSSDGKHLVYWGVREEKIVACVAGREIQIEGGPSQVKRVWFSADAQHYAHATVVGNQTSVFRDGKLARTSESVEVFGFSPDGKHFAYRVGTVENQTVIVDDKPSAPMLAGRGFRFSPDSKRWAYLMVTSREGKGRAACVIDGTPGKAYDDLMGVIAFSPNGARVAYAVPAQNKVRLVIDNQEGYSCDWLTYDGNDTPVRFSPDSTRYAVFAFHGTVAANGSDLTNGRQCVAIDGRESDSFEHACAGSQWSPDSRYFVCSMNNGGRLLTPQEAGIPVFAHADPRARIVSGGEFYLLVNTQVFREPLGLGQHQMCLRGWTFTDNDRMYQLTWRSGRIMREEVLIQSE